MTRFTRIVLACSFVAGLAVVGCDSPKPAAKDKMATDKMNDSKMNDKMGDKMSGDKMGNDKMGDAKDKMAH